VEVEQRVMKSERRGVGGAWAFTIGAAIGGATLSLEKSAVGPKFFLQFSLFSSKFHIYTPERQKTHHWTLSLAS
jgi:hypothetical protein